MTAPELVDACPRCHSRAFRGPRPSEPGGAVYCAQCGAEWQGESEGVSQGATGRNELAELGEVG